MSYRPRPFRSARVSRGGFAAGAASTGLAAFVRTPAAAQLEFKCGSELAPDHPAVVRMVQMWNAVERESGGRLKVKVFANDQLGNPAAMFSQLRLGALQFQLISPANLSAVIPVLDITSVGFAFKDEAEGLRACDGALGAYFQQEVAAKGIYLFRKVFDIGMYQVGSMLRPIRTPEDLHGFKIRIAQSKLTVDLFKALGATATPLAFNEVYTGLQTKLVDGEAAPVVVIETQRFFEVNRYLSLTNHAWSCSWIVANGDVWKSIPADVRQIVDRNAEKYITLARRDNKQLSASIQDKLTRQGIAVNTVDQAPFRTRLASYYDGASAMFGAAAMELLQNSISHKLTSS